MKLITNDHNTLKVKNKKNWDKIFNILIIIILIMIIFFVIKDYNIDYYKFCIVITIIISFIYSVYIEWNTDNLNLNTLFNPWKFYSFFINRFLSEHIFHPSFFFPLSLSLVLYLLKIKSFEFDEGVILFITFLSILWYTKKTMILRQAQQILISLEKEKIKDNQPPGPAPAA